VKEPEPEPVVAESPVPPKTEQAVEPVSNDNFWVELLRQVRARRPLIEEWVKAGALLNITNDTCLVGFPKEQSIAMESVLRPANKKLIEDLISVIAGRPLGLRCELREGLVVIPPQLPETPLVDTKAKTEDDFKNDPKIRKAMEIFEAEILSN
jgi:hypothetical protein